MKFISIIKTFIWLTFLLQIIIDLYGWIIFRDYIAFFYVQERLNKYKPNLSIK